MAPFRFLGKIIGYFATLAFFAVFGPGFMAVSWNKVSVDCVRQEKIDCTLSDAYFFGLIQLKSKVYGARAIEHVVHDRVGHGVITSNIKMVGESGSEPIGHLASNFGGSQKSGMILAFDEFVGSSEPHFAHSELTVATPFLLFSIPFVALLFWSLLAPFRVSQPVRVKRWNVTLQSALTPPPIPERLPLVLVQGFAFLQKYAKYATVLLVAVLAAQLGLLAMGWLGSYMEVVVTGMFIWSAIAMTRIKRIELGRMEVKVSYEGWLPPREWREPMTNYEGIYVVANSGDNGVTYQAELTHRTNRKRNIKLWRRPVFSKSEALERAQRYENLLGLRVDTSKCA